MEQELPPIQIKIRPAYLAGLLLLMVVVCVLGGTTFWVLPASTSIPRSIDSWTPFDPASANILYQLTASTRGWQFLPDTSTHSLLTFSTDRYKPHQRPNTHAWSCYFASTLQISFAQAAPFGTLVHMDVTDHQIACPDPG
jgi:hypothetical protein